MAREAELEARREPIELWSGTVLAVGLGTAVFLAVSMGGLYVYYLYGLLPLRKRPSGWGVLASLRTCIRRLGSDPSARMANPHARASTDGRPTSGRDSSQALRASV